MKMAGQDVRDPSSSEDVGQSMGARRAFERRLTALAAPIEAYWGQGFRVSVGGDKACFNWCEVMIPQSECEKSDDALSCLLLHEWGHRTLAPVTVALGYWWEILARQEGVTPAGVAVNIACDLIIDKWYMGHPVWGEMYRCQELNGLRKRMQTDQGRSVIQNNALFRFLVACYASITEEKEKLPHFDVETPVAEAAVKELFDGSKTTNGRVRGFCRVALPVLKEWAKTNSSPLWGYGAGSCGTMEPIIGRSSPWRGKNWNPDDLIRLLMSDSGQVPREWVHEICGAVVARRVHARLRVLESLARVSSKVEATTKRLQAERYEGMESWRIGDSLHELDAKATLERSGLILPGVTTLRKRRGRSHEARSSLPALCLVVDNSGSTQGTVIQGELDAAVALLEVARHTKVSVSAVVFGSNVAASVAPGHGYDEIELLFGGLSGQSGGTCLVPALRQALQWLPKDGIKMGTLIFTDSYIYDTVEAVPLLASLTARGPVVFLCVDDKLDSSALHRFRSIRPAPRVVQYCPGRPLVDDALDVLG